MALVNLASGAPSYKYGTDVIDTAKASFGYRGVIIPLFGLLATLAVFVVITPLDVRSNSWIPRPPSTALTCTESVGWET